MFFMIMKSSHLSKYDSVMDFEKDLVHAYVNFNSIKCFIQHTKLQMIKI